MIRATSGKTTIDPTQINPMNSIVDPLLFCFVFSQLGQAARRSGETLLHLTQKAFIDKINGSID
ncbi:MAG: hypothetical protein QF920_10595 [Verrucomicrobiota bacterium]|nr:hypothetical protein [Verrucomicrobiota bacterium]